MIATVRIRRAALRAAVVIASLAAPSSRVAAQSPIVTLSPSARSPHGMVVTGSRLASAVGASVLERGGNAIDAAVAAAFALAVVEPERIAREAERLREFEGSRRHFLKANGGTYAAGDLFRQSALSRTLRLLARDGAESFYRGEIADTIARELRGASGALVTRADLAGYHAEASIVVRGRYRTYDVFGAYLPASGATTIEVLQILDQGDPGTLRVPNVAAALLLGFEDRAATLSPPAAKAAWLISDSLARRRFRDIPSAAEARARSRRHEAREPEHTTHVSVADADGNVVALTQSVGPNMGSRVASPALGFLYAATMEYLGELEPGTRRHWSSQSPLIVMRDGQPAFVLGGGGGRRIISAIVQTLVRAIDEGLPLDRAVAAPRLHPTGGRIDMEVHRGATWSEPLLADLRARGFNVRARDDAPYFARINAIQFDPATHDWVGVADPRWEGTAAAPHTPEPAAAAAEDDVVFESSIQDLQRMLAEGRVTSVQLVDAYLARIAAYDQAGPALNTILALNPRARADAAALDAERAASGPRGPLHGIPVLLKDNFDTRDMPTTAGSIALAGVVPPDDAFQVRRLRAAGAILLGKTNLHELASGITTISSIGGQTRNAYDPSRNPGGSSGGTGAAVAASFAAIGYGTDTCGSIRIPAAHANLFGLRPTKGLSSVDGIVPLSHTQDVAGPLARSVTDLAIGLDATVGPDTADPATRVLQDGSLPRFAAALDTFALRGARIGILTQLFGDSAEDRVAGDIVRAAIESMRRAGASVEHVQIAGLDTLLRGSGVIDYEFEFDLADYLARTPAAQIRSLGEILERGLYHPDLGPRFHRRDSLGTRTGAEYVRALERQKVLRRALEQTLQRRGLDALAYPTVNRAPAPIGDPQRGSTCQLSAASGLPALSMPAGFTAEGLPIGVELLGAGRTDARLVSLAFSYEQAVRPRRPPPLTPPLAGSR